jgi:di/tricarboxylate transporter
LELRRIQKAPYALVIFLAVLVTAAFGIFDVSALMLTGAIAMVLTGVLSMDEAYRSIDWKAVFLIAGMLPMGEAMEKTGTAQYMADQLVAFTGDFSTYAVLACVFLLTAALTSIISNAATTVLIVPIAINIALNLGVDPRPFIMTTILAASTSFLTPVGHQVNIVILGAGGYKFLDYTRVGIGLTILVLLICLTVVPMIWQF